MTCGGTDMNSMVTRLVTVKGTSVVTGGIRDRPDKCVCITNAYLAKYLHEYWTPDRLPGVMVARPVSLKSVQVKNDQRKKG